MNPAIQPATHLDVELLNAFVEDALPAHERDQVLTHLAACGHCRQIVHLAQDAAGELPESAVAAVESIIPRRKPISLFQGWRFAWIPAAALTAFALIVWTDHTIHPERSTPNIAASGPANPPPAIQAYSAPNAPQAKHNLLPPPPIEPSAKAVAPEIAQQAVSRPQATAAAKATVSVETADVSAATPVASAAGLEQNRAASASPPSLASQAPIKPEADQLTVAANATAVQDLPIGGRDEGELLKMQNGRSNALYADKKSPSSLNESLAHSALYAKLPSGFIAVSTAAISPNLLALDAQGELFLSSDAGKSWQPIASQWTGKALQLRVLDLPSRQQANTAPPTTSPIFELITTPISTWTSKDGKTWLRGLP